MFKKRTKASILVSYTKLATPIVKLDKLPAVDSEYLHFITQYQGEEITPDINILGYEAALNQNRYMANHYPTISQFLWLIASSGQGDGWFISKETSHILFYDHDLGEYADLSQFLDLEISFPQFLQMADLYQQLDNLLDEQDELSSKQILQFQSTIDTLHPALFHNYPFDVL